MELDGDINNYRLLNYLKKVAISRLGIMTYALVLILITFVGIIF